MGNCQAVDAASLVIQHPNGGEDRLYAAVDAGQIMKMHPGHHVALLLATTVYTSPVAGKGTHMDGNTNTPVRVTRIKLLKQGDTLLLGHVYRLVSSREVMKGLVARKQAKLKESTSSEFDVVGRVDGDKTRQVVCEKQRARHKQTSPRSSVSSRSRAWQPSLRSISEVGT